MSLAILEQKIATLPAQCVTELEDYVDFLIQKYCTNKKDDETESYFGALKNKISFISSDFDEPLEEDFKDYM